MKSYSPSELDHLTLVDVDCMSFEQIDYYFQILSSHKQKSLKHISNEIEKKEDNIEMNNETPPLTPDAQSIDEDKMSYAVVDGEAKSRSGNEKSSKISKKNSKSSNKKNVEKKTKKSRQNSVSLKISPKISPKRHFLRSATRAKMIKKETFDDECDHAQEGLCKNERSTSESSCSNNSLKSEPIRKRSSTEICHSIEVSTSYGNQKKTSKSGFKQFMSSFSSKIWSNESSSSLNKANESFGVIQTSVLRPKDVRINSENVIFPKSNVSMTPDRDQRMQEIANFKGNFRSSFNERRNLWERRSFKS